MTLTLDLQHTPQPTADDMTLCPALDPDHTPDVPTPDQLAALEREIAITSAHLDAIKTGARALLAALPGATVTDCKAAIEANGNRGLIHVIAAMADRDRADRAPEVTARPLPDARRLKVTAPDTSRDLDAIVHYLPAGALDRLHELRALRNSQFQAALPSLIEALRTELEANDEVHRLAGEAVAVFPGVGDPHGRAMDALLAGDHDPLNTLVRTLPADRPDDIDTLTNLMNGATT